jgi:hypothetical protein
MKRRDFPIALAALASVAGCSLRPPTDDPFTRPQIDWSPGLLLDRASAQRVLGNPCHLEKATAYLDGQTKTYQCAFRDDAFDPLTGKAGILYYMYEEHESAAGARSFLDSTLRANRLDPGDGIRVDSGAQLHYFAATDVVRMVMIRKENRLVRLKVNPVTSHYSFAEFRNVAAELAGKL